MKNTEFLDDYRNADPKTKLEILLQNYSVVPKKIEFFQIRIRNNIKNEMEYARGQRRGETGVRVNTSSKSDPTCAEAMTDFSLDEAFETGTIRLSVLNEIENGSKYEVDIKTISVLKNDYELLSLIVENLGEADCKLLHLRFVERKTFSVIGEEVELHEDTVRRKLKNLMDEIDAEILDSFELSSRILKSYKGGKGHEGKS